MYYINISTLRQIVTMAINKLEGNIRNRNSNGGFGKPLRRRLDLTGPEGQEGP